MKLRHTVPLLLLVPLVLGGCKKKPATGPTPADSSAATTGTTNGGVGAGTVGSDSVTLLEREREERARRDREAAASVAREALTDIVFFEYDSDEITPTAEDKLTTKAAIMRSNPSLRLRIEGHADQRGSTEYNLALGQRRAEAVRAYLVNLGIDGGRLATVSFGKEKPLMEGEDEDAFARNRRAEFGIAGGQIVTVPAELRR